MYKLCLFPYFYPSPSSALLVRMAAWRCQSCSTRWTTSGSAPSQTMEAWEWTAMMNCEKVNTDVWQTCSLQWMWGHPLVQNNQLWADQQEQLRLKRPCKPAEDFQGTCSETHRLELVWRWILILSQKLHNKKQPAIGFHIFNVILNMWRHVNFTVVQMSYHCVECSRRTTPSHTVAKQLKGTGSNEMGHNEERYIWIMSSEWKNEWNNAVLYRQSVRP